MSIGYHPCVDQGKYRRKSVGRKVPATSDRETIMGRTPNDDRSDSLNPNSDSYKSSQDNRSDQLNPNNERYQGSEAEEEDDND